MALRPSDLPLPNGVEVLTQKLPFVRRLRRTVARSYPLHKLSGRRPRCLAEATGPTGTFVCTRFRSHAGPHVAHDRASTHHLPIAWWPALVPPLRHYECSIETAVTDEAGPVRGTVGAETAAALAATPEPELLEISEYYSFAARPYSRALVMKQWPEAPEGLDTWCRGAHVREAGGHWHCSRILGHAGPHVAYAAGEPMAAWPAGLDMSLSPVLGAGATPIVTGESVARALDTPDGFRWIDGPADRGLRRAIAIAFPQYLDGLLGTLGLCAHGGSAGLPARCSRPFHPRTEPHVAYDRHGEPIAWWPDAVGQARLHGVPFFVDDRFAGPGDYAGITRTPPLFLSGFNNQPKESDMLPTGPGNATYDPRIAERETLERLRREAERMSGRGGGGLASMATPPPTQPPIQALAEILHEDLSILDKAVAGLYDKLSPVLASARPTESQTSMCTPNMAPFSERLAAAIDRVRSLTGLLRDIYDRAVL